MATFFRVPMDERDLNNDRNFADGDKDWQSYSDYTSDNTIRLIVEQAKEKLLKLDYSLLLK